MPTIVLADQSLLMRQSLQMLLETQPGFAIVGETGDRLKLPKLMDELRPDVLIIDVAILGTDGPHIIRGIPDRWPTTRIIIFSLNEPRFVQRELADRVATYISKQTPVSRLVAAVRQSALL
jgi:DNA-binding NarL/FixJ family response regulator